MQEYSDSDKKTIASALAACMSVQRTYGKQANELSVTAKTFCTVLGNYPAHDVAQAIKKWILKSQDFPTPADINQILSGKKVLDPRIYSRITATLRSQNRLNNWEWSFMKDYEEQSLND